MLTYLKWDIISEWDYHQAYKKSGSVTQVIYILGVILEQEQIKSYSFLVSLIGSMWHFDFGSKQS